MMSKGLQLLLALLIVGTFQLESFAAMPQPQVDVEKWKIASRFIVANKTKKAKRILLELVRSSHVPKDLLYLTLARLHFQDRQFKQALRYYRNVDQDSAYWMEAKEELAWTYIRMDKAPKAIANGTTLLSPIFLGQLGPEPYFMMSYAYLMICDYESIFSMSEKFKKNESAKVDELTIISSGKTSKVLARALNKLRKGPYHTSTIAEELPVLPRQFLRDKWFKMFWQAKNTSRAYRRVQTLARTELKEYRKIIHKLHLVEAEVIQRLHLAESKIGKRKQISKTAAKGSEIMTFPETQEIWVDELDNYHLDAKDCPKIMQVKL